MSASTALALSRLARVASGAAASAPTTAGVAAAVSSDLPLLAPRSRLAQSPGSSSMSASTAVALSRLVRAASGAAASTPTTARVVAAASGSSRHDEEASAAGVQMKAVRDGPLTTLLASEFRSRLPLSPMPLSPPPPPRPPPQAGGAPPPTVLSVRLSSPDPKRVEAASALARRLLALALGDVGGSPWAGAGVPPQKRPPGRRVLLSVPRGPFKHKKASMIQFWRVKGGRGGGGAAHELPPTS